MIPASDACRSSRPGPTAGAPAPLSPDPDLRARSDPDAGRGQGRKPLIVHVFPSFAFGGVPIRMSRVIEHLADRYRHVIVSLDGCFDSRSRIGKDVDVRYLEVSFPKGQVIKALLRARAALADLGPDLLVTYNWGSIEWALARTMFAAGRHIHCESGFGPEEAHRQIARRCFLRRAALLRTDYLIVPSHVLVKIATEQWRIGAKKILHIPNGVAIGRFSGPPDPVECRRIGLTGLSAGPIVGTLVPLRAEKNLDCLIRAFAVLPTELSARLAILGDGNDRSRLVDLVRELGVESQVLFAGHVERPDLVLGALDLFVLSSDTEQMPNSLIQAMAAGLPVAATDVGDVRRMLPTGNQPFLVPAGDSHGLAVAMETLLRDDVLRAEIGEQNRHHAEVEFDECRMLDRYTEVLAECLE